MLLSFNDFIKESKKTTIVDELNEGGAFGHMAHPYDDINLTFGEISEIIEISLSGELNKEEQATEKLDGQALAISWKNGHLIAARNKGDRKNAGEDALSVQGVIDKFEGRGEISNAFGEAARDLESALSRIPEDKLEDLFDEGKKFMHLEIIYPGTTNVINYDTAKLIFHSITTYDMDGNPIDDDKKAAAQLQKIIKDVNADIQKTYHISPPTAINLPKHIEFDEKKDYFLKKLSNIEKEAGLNSSATIADYIKFKFMELIDNKDKDSEIDDATLIGLLNRWIRFDKSFNLRKIDTFVKNKSLAEWIYNFDKKGAAEAYKEFLKPFEYLFLELGATILKNAAGFMAANPDEAVQKIKKEIERVAREIENSKDITKMDKLKTELDRIQALGGFEAIVPIEGLVFVYNGKTYKFTGSFAPVGQILGTLKYSK